MTKRLLKTMILPLTVMATALAFIACDGTTPDVKYKVTYVIGENAEGTAPTETDKATGEKFKLKSADGITCEGATFDGWSDGSLTYKAGDTYTMPSKAVTFTAQWTPDGTVEPTTYNVTYKYGDAGTDVVKENQTAENYAVEAPAKYIDTGKDEEYLKLFAGWTKENGDGTVYLPDSKYTLTGDTVFTAQWIDYDDDNEWVDTTYELQLKLLTDKVGALILNLGGEDEENPDLSWTYFTYALNDTAITITPVEGNPATGTLEDGELTLSITVGLATYEFKSELALPEFTFGLNGGTGELPTLTVTEDMYDDAEGSYVVTMPENTITPPAGKQFKEWLVTASSGGERRVKAGENYYAAVGATLTVTPEWKDVADPLPEGTVFYGNCTLPVDKTGKGGETVISVIINNADAQNIKVYYKLVGDDTYQTSTKGSNAYESYKPDVYGSDALYYGEYFIGVVTYNMVVKSDLTALYLCDNDDNLLDDGEFTTSGVTPPAPVTYTVTYVKPSGVDGEVPAVATVDEGAVVTLAAATQFTKAGWTFVNWAVTGYSVLRAPNTNVTVTQNTTITPVFSADYNGDYGKIAVRDNGTLVMNGETYSYTRNGDIVVIDIDGYLMTVKANDEAKTYIMPDGMQALTFTAANGTTLTFDGSGAATLGTHKGTYTLSEDNDKFTLVIGGNTYANIAIDTTINVTIMIDGTDYVFGNNTPNPPPPATDKLADYASADTSGVFYGYTSADNATTAGKNITATNISNAERTFYQAKVFTNFSGKFSITITANTGSVSTPKDSNNSDIAITEDTPNQTVYITSGSWANTFVITFSKNSDGKRVMTITYGDITVEWVEMPQA